MDTFEILVVILSVMLALFLLVGIIVFLVAYRILKRVEQMSVEAESMVHNVSEASVAFKRSIGSVAVARAVNTLIRSVRARK